MFFDIQLNLSTTALGPKKWPLFIDDRSEEVFQLKLQCNLVWPVLGWPLLTGGCYSEVVVNTGLTVPPSTDAQKGVRGYDTVPSPQTNKNHNKFDR
jgi:hypothetical protein